ncbi:filamentous hemagglutinin N-terminal domain-containing protein, partial [Mitsuokella sp. WILCCON 0060]|uniref:two-partner secretion domain-containing protein n=1 Tax=Mitsuokella sp. WILCCON 0060 TaxID=3345341 RepID=UPI003F1B533E
MKTAMRKRKEWQRQTAAITAALMAMSVGGIAYAMPQGENIRSGKGEITRQDKDMTINQDSKRLAIDWAGFDIANDERVTFQQPGKDAVALNRVVGNAASVIDGTLAGNGHVYVVNPNGVLFGKGASVDVGSLVASTAKISDADMMNFGTSDGAISMAVPEDSQAKVINAGTIRAEGGLVVLHAADARNTGTITNPGGTTALAAAKNLSISADTAGKINFTVDGKLAQAKALNSGTLSANGGYLVMTARSAGDVMSTVVNNTGTMEAKTLRQNEKGEILLDGGDHGVVELGGTIDASGMEAGQSAGSIKAIGAETHVGDDANLLAKGNVDGGLIETSGDYLEISDKANIDAAGGTGSAGEWLLDPTNVVINDTGSSKVASGDNQYTSGTTYLKTSSIIKALQNNNVKIQAVDREYGNADITLDSALNVNQTTTGKNTFTLESQGDVNINADIKATSPLNVVLNADSDGNDKGGVNINADIRTGGGSLTTGKNGATFFGSTQEGEANRVIETAGGAVNIQNEARLQLNGGTLSINTSGGNVTFAKNVASMNKYEAFMDHDFVDYYEGKISDWTEQARNWDNILQSIYGKTYTDSNGVTKKFAIARQTYYGYGQQVVANYSDLKPAEKVQLSNALAQTWELANLAATQGNSAADPDGKQLNGTHLVTITDKYENSAAMANAVKKSGAVLEYFTGGKETTNMSANRTSGRKFAWVTGPEKGTTFYISSGIGQGSDQNGMYTNWVQGGNGYSEPNNNNGLTKQPYVAIGWTDENGWDDVHNGASTIHGFIRETELPNSALAINSGAGNVTVGTEGTANTGKLGSGVGTGLRNVSIETTAGDVKVLDSIYVHDNNTNAAADLANGNVKITTQGNVDVGKITADKKVEISSTGAEKHVNVNGNIATDGLVSIESADDITVHGIQNADKIRLVSTDANGNGAITLADNTDGNGALITSSNANDAVIIDARGANGSFHNNTTGASAITTGTDGNWKVYSASPDRDEFGTNLNSNTNAQWNATSSTYSAANDGNKYIFQVQPKMNVAADDKEKTYGVELSENDLTVKKAAAFKGQNGTDIDVHNYENAFQEGDVMSHYTGTINAESAGAAAAATRTGGVRTADDNNKAIYDIAVSGNLESKDGYGAAEFINGNLEINRRTVNLNGSAAQTYGDATLNNKTVYAESGSGDTGLYGNDKLDTDKVEYAISTTGKYEANKGSRVTADAGTYADELEFSNVHAVNGTTNMDANYTFTGNGDVTVDKKTIQKDELGIDGKPLYTTTYGTKKDLGTATFHGVNGDGTYDLAITDTTALTGETTGKVTKDVGDNYSTTVELNDALAKNYQFEGGAASKEFADTASVTKAKLTVNTKGFEATYGDVDTVKKDLENAVTISGLINGDGPATETVNGTSEALITVNGEERTNDVKKGGYEITANLGSLQDTINKNYEVEKTGGNAVITKKDIQILTDDINTTYGDGDTIYNGLAAGNLLHLDGLVSWDSENDILKALKAYTTIQGNVSPYKLDANGNIVTDSEGHRYTNDARGYSISTKYSDIANNYHVASVKTGMIRVNKAPLTINRSGIDTVYGTVKLDDGKMTSHSALVNGDIDDITYDNGSYGNAYLDGNKRTNNVGKYSYRSTLNSASNVLRNYVLNDTEWNYVNITPFTIDEDQYKKYINSSYKTIYGEQAAFGKATFTGVNGDTATLDITDSDALVKNGGDRKTQDAAKNAY